MTALKSIDFTKPGTLLWVTVVFVLLNAFAISIEIYVLSLLPFALLGAWLLIYRPDFALLGVAFITPLSVNLENLSELGGIGISLPSELILVGMLLLYAFKLLTGFREDQRLLSHPLSVAIVFSLLWMFITSVLSTDPVVSFKFLLAKLWFVGVMYFLINRFFAKEGFIKWFLWLSIIGVALVIVYTIIRHSQHAFGEKAAHWVMTPFYKDHTSYGAAIAMLYPLVIYHFWKSKLFSISQVFWAGITLTFTIGLVLSYTRAAWVSLIGALGVYILMKLRIDIRVVVLGALLLLASFFAFEDTITHQIRKNRQDSSGDLKEHVQSISNVSSDASNLERLNRWSSAMRMWQDKPFFGFGPGTYMFQYATYQKSSDKTIISTNLGDGGNAHSEYLGPLSEQGVIGALCVLIIFGISLYTGITLYYKMTPGSYLQGVVMCLVLGLVTYYLHGILNNYLDTDKASVPVWSMMSMLIAISIYHRKSAVT